MAESRRQDGARGDAALRGSVAVAGLEASLDPIFIVDDHGTVRLVSESVERLFGWTRGELVGRSVGVLLPERHKVPHEHAFEEYRRERDSPVIGRTRELVAMHRDGSPVRIELTVSRFEGPEGSDLFCAVVHDISARKQSEDELDRHRLVLEELVRERTAELESSHQKLRMADRLVAIGTLAAGLGHDMNNVLLPVRAHLNALLAEGLSGAALLHARAIRRSIRYLQQLADGLHFLVLDPEREKPPQLIRLHRWWEQTGPLLCNSVPGHVRVTAAIPGSLPPVRIAPHHLTQAVLNLLVNAGEAIAPRRRRQGLVRVWAEPSEDGANIRLGVTDNGRGMTEEVRRRVFEVFFTTKTRGMGTGLGLPLVRRVVERAGGSVEIQSTPEVGTTVVLSLPTASESVPGRGTREGSPRAVVSPADPRAAHLVRQLLDSAGVAVEMAEEPGDADLWVLRPEAGAASRVSAWQGEGLERIAVLLGPPQDPADPAWRSIKRVIIQDINDLDSVRGALGDALANS